MLVLYFNREARILPLDKIITLKEQEGQNTDISIDMSDILMNLPLNELISLNLKQIDQNIQFCALVNDSDYIALVGKSAGIVHTVIF